MMPEDTEASLAALGGLSKQMRRGRFMDALPEEERREITLVLSPDGSAEIVSDTGDNEGGVSEDEESAEALATSDGLESEPSLEEDPDDMSELATR